MGFFRLLDIDTEETSPSTVLDQATVVQCDALKFAKWTKKVEEVGDVQSRIHSIAVLS